jgi:hypothetical protein
MRTSIARQVLPYPYENEWKTRADDVLVFGSSAIGAYKRHLDLPLVDYRVHANNHFTNKKYPAAEKLRRSLAINRLTKWFVDEMGYELSLLPNCLQREFRTQQQPTMKEWLAYQKLAISSSLSIAGTCKHLAATSWHYAREKFRRVRKDKASCEHTAESVRQDKARLKISDPLSNAA